MSHSSELPFFIYEVAVDGVVRYIGKGCRTRHLDHARAAKRINRLRADGQTVKTSRFINRLAKAIRQGELVSQRIVQRFATEAEALQDECVRIESAPAGSLWNGNEGGAGVTSASAIEAWKDEGRKAKQSVRSREMWRDPHRKAELIAILAAGQTSETRAASARKRWGSEAYRDKQKKIWADPAYKARVLEKRKEAIARPSVKSAQSKALKERWTSLEYRERRAAAVTAAYDSSPKLRSRISETSKARWADPEQRARLIAAQRAGHAAKRARKEERLADGRGAEQH